MSWEKFHLEVANGLTAKASTEPSCVSWEKVLFTLHGRLPSAGFNGAQLRELGKDREFPRARRANTRLQRSPAA